VSDAIEASDRAGYGDSASKLGANPSADRAAALAAARADLQLPALAGAMRRCQDLYEAYSRLAAR
jgi:hypothetical protein